MAYKWRAPAVAAEDAEGAEVAAAAEAAVAEAAAEAAASHGELAAGARADRFPIPLKAISSRPGPTRSIRPMHVLLVGWQAPATVA
jgi:hypothetical protein